MASPAKQAPAVSLFYGGQWNDHSDILRARVEITMTRGQANEQQQAPPATASLAFDGWTLNPSNVSSALYGLIGLNTPILIEVDSDIRFVGEVSSWAPRQSLGATSVDRWVVVEATGINRRLGQGAEPLRSAMFREVMSAAYDSVRVGYWPMEDGRDSSGVSSALPGGEFARRHGPGGIDFASHNGFPGSAPILTLGTDSWLEAAIPRHANGFTCARVAYAIAAAAMENDSQLLHLWYRNGTVDRVRILYGATASGSAKVQLLDGDATVIDESSLSGLGGGLDGQQFLLTLTLDQDGSDIDWTLSAQRVGLDGALGNAGSDSGTFTGQTLGRAHRWRIGSFGMTDCAVGHLMIGSASTLAGAIDSALTGWAGEHAGRRIERLCDEEGIPFVGDLAHDLDDTQPMGPQRVAALPDLLADCRAVDLGLLLDGTSTLNDDPALDYRPLRDLYNQDATLELDYDAAEVAPPLEPVVDDRDIRNDVTVSRRDGGSARAMATSTTGRYRHAVTINAMSDELLGDQAGWRLLLGTVGGIRYARVSVDLVASPGLVSAVHAIAEGDLLTIDNLPATLTPDLANLIVLGWAEAIGTHRRLVTFHCVPAEPYQIAEVAHAAFGIVQSATAVTTEALDTTETGVDINAGAGGNWVDEGDFPIEIGGERMTVTAVSAMSGTFPNRTCTLTVTRSTNGVVKSHASGASVRFTHRSYVGL